MPSFVSVRANLSVTDVPQAAAYFHKMLGFDVRVSMGEPMNFAIVGREGAEMVLMAEPTAAVPAAASCYVNVTGIDEVHAHCVAQGAELSNPLTTWPWGQRDFVLRGPNGHQIAVGEHVG